VSTVKDANSPDEVRQWMISRYLVTLCSVTKHSRRRELQKVLREFEKDTWRIDHCERRYVNRAFRLMAEFTDQRHCFVVLTFTEA
jgi:hypothetical protein